MLQAPNNDPQNTGVLMTVLGLIVLVATYLWWKSMERGIAGDITECESQLEALMSQVRKTEQEKKDLSQALPDHGGSMEQLLREAEHDLGSCEALLPVYHNEQAARQRMQSAKRQGAHALSGLKSARSQWQKTLQQIGLADSLSPKSIRILAEGYESLSQTRKRFKAQNDELSQRKIELNSAVQKLDALSTQVHVALTESNKGKETIPSIKVAALSSPVATHTIEAPQQRLQELVNTLAQHQQFLAQRRELKNEDEELGKKQKLLRRLMERNIRARQSMLADLAVETPQQLEEHLAKKNDHLRLETEISNLDDRIKGLIGLHVAYDAVARMLGNSSASELEKRWETLGSRISGAEERIGQLLQRQGEISQEMKTLAADRRLAEAKLELSCLERQIDLCAAHWRTLGVTTCMLEKVCEVYETERQPETLREASTFLKQLTDGKYVRVWTPLGKNALRIDNERGQSLPLEVLSRGTREAVFIALRLSLAAAYSRRGVTLPLVLDDVLVNFDSARATHAAKVLRDFAALGHQVIMFTCHEHIMKMFHSIDVQVRVLPEQGVPGEARVYNPGYVPVVPATKPMQPVPVAETPVLEPAPQVVSVHPVVLVDPPADPPSIVPIKPRRQPAKRPRIVEEPIEAGMWFDDDISDVAQTLAEGSESAELKLWTEIEELTQPFDGAPHDAWWEAHQN
jgi:DNA repair exonuclease SbcCD ATPase subunit